MVLKEVVVEILFHHKIVAGVDQGTDFDQSFLMKLLNS